MDLKARILNLVHQENGGPRPRKFLDAYACRAGKDESFVQGLIAEGALVKYGDRKGAKWGLPQ